MATTKAWQDSIITRFFLPAEQRKAEIYEVVHEVVQGINEQLHAVKEDFNEQLRTVDDTLFDIFWSLDAGADIRNVLMIRYVPVRIYLDHPERDYFERQLYALNSVIEKLLQSDFERAVELPTESGSAFKRFWYRTLHKLTHGGVEDKVKKAFEGPQADATKSLAESVATLTSSIGDLPYASI